MRTAARTAFLMAVLTLVSKFIGFIRELLLANYYGTGYIIDAYVMAIAIPGIIFGGIFAAISTAYMPIFSRKMEIDGEIQANRFTSEITNLALAVSILAGLVGIIFSGQIVSIFASGFEGETAALTSFYIKITFFYVMFSSALSLMETYLQYKGVFLPQVIAGYAQNAVIISIIIISAYTTHYILVLGWLFGYAIRMGIMLLRAKKKGFTYTPTLKVKGAARDIVLLAIPVFVGSSMNQINMFIDKTLASGLPQGSIAALNYGGTIITMISGLTISILVTICYPKLAQASSLNESNRFSNILSTGINLIAIIAIPCSLGAMAFSNQIVQIIYERGAFDAAATAFTSSAFLFYAVGMFFSSTTSLLNQAYYSLHNMKSPMIFAAVGVIINVVFNLILIRFMAHNGLALATSISAICTAIFMFLGFRKKYPDLKIVKSKLKLILIVFSAVISVTVSWLFYCLVGNAVLMPKTILFVLTVTSAGIVYLLMLIIFKIEEVNLLKQIIIKR
ncbi:MAG TPA: murein biosynthesis integral membrane protein MurJ [Patescibacteria group bacterium]|nr:murein biosynthesis integral membrane protein MurJ [Patescibacteria group bacterium]